MDLLLAEAFVVYQDSLCRGCGQPASLAFDPFNAGEFEVQDETFCLACEQLESRKEEKLGDGQKRFVVAHFDEPVDEPVVQPPRQFSFDKRAFAPFGAPPGMSSATLALPPVVRPAVMSLALPTDAPLESMIDSST